MGTTLNFKENFLTFPQYAKVGLKSTLKNRPFFYVLIIPFLTILMFWGQFPWRTVDLHTFWEKTGAYVFLMTFLFIFIPFSMWRGFKKNYEAARFMHQPADYQFSDAGMDMHSSIMQAHIEWELFHSFYNFGRYGVLMTGNATGYFLDFNALQSPATKTDFLDLVKKHNLKVK